MDIKNRTGLTEAVFLSVELSNFIDGDRMAEVVHLIMDQSGGVQYFWEGWGR